MENANDILVIIYSGVLTIGVGVIGFFLKRCFSTLDEKVSKSALKEHVDSYAELKTDVKSKADKDELKKGLEEIKEIRDRYASKEELREIRSQMNEMKESINFLKEETVRRSDFIRVTGEMSSKIDDLSSYLRSKI